MPINKKAIFTAVIIIIQVLFVLGICYELESYTSWFYGDSINSTTTYKSLESRIIPLHKSISQKLNNSKVTKYKNNKQLLVKDEENTDDEQVSTTVVSELKYNPQSTQVDNKNDVRTTIIENLLDENVLGETIASPTQSKLQQLDMQNDKRKDTEIESENVRFRPDKRMLYSEVFDNIKNVKKVDMLVICLTAPFKKSRRDAIRQTWWQSCKNNSKVACWFLTDGLEFMKSKALKSDLLEEQKKYNDMIFGTIGKGIHFGFRFLHLIQWGMANYDFNYIVRTDDDIFFCVDHLLSNLPLFPKQYIHWGYLHCDANDLVYIDEGMCMFSKDVIVKFLSQKPDEILCHPYGDQQIAIWEQSIGFNTRGLYVPETRLQHDPPASHVKRFKTMNNICDNYIYLHGVYGNDMLTFWESRGHGEYEQYKFKTPHEVCPLKLHLDWRKFSYTYHFEPKPCIDKPSWRNDKADHYGGRETK